MDGYGSSQGLGHAQDNCNAPGSSMALQLDIGLSQKKPKDITIFFVLQGPVPKDFGQVLWMGRIAFPVWQAGRGRKAGRQRQEGRTSKESGQAGRQQCIEMLEPETGAPRCWSKGEIQGSANPRIHLAAHKFRSVHKVQVYKQKDFWRTALKT